MELLTMTMRWYCTLLLLTITSRTKAIERPVIEEAATVPNCLPGTPDCFFERRKRPYGFSGEILHDCPHSSHECAIYSDCPEVIEMLRDDNDTVVKQGQLHYCGFWDPFGPLVCCLNKSTHVFPSKSVDYPTLPVGECGVSNMHLLSNKIYTYLEAEVDDTVDCQHFRRGRKRDTGYHDCLTQKERAKRILTSTREKKSTRDKRLIGGRPARLGQWPWLAAIIFGYLEREYATIFPSRHLAFGCVGTIIDERHILTSAYCVIKLHYKNGLIPYHVIVGDYELANSTGPDRVNQEVLNDVLYTLDIKPQKIKVDRVLGHENFDEYYYSPNAFKDDIAMLRLAKKIQYNDYVQPICLPTSEAPNDIKGHLTGDFTTAAYSFHGAYIYNSLPRTLHLPSVNLSVCEEKYTKYFSTPVKLDADKMYCAGGNLNEGLCGLDQGAPLMKSAKDGRMFLVGVAAEAGLESCDVTDRPGLFTRVDAYMPWIIKTLGSGRK